MDYSSELLNYYFHFAKAVVSMKTIAFNKIVVNIYCPLNF